MLLDSVRQYLASQHMLVDNEWLSGCVEYLTEDSDSNRTEQEIKNLAREQWLLNDLKDICPGSLPPNLNNLAKTVLPGRYVLQINAAIDIGTPAYQQYLKLQKINMDNVEATTKFEDKVPSHRMIKLYVTDGVQNVTAIEYRPMRNLSCDITPGIKMLLKGPVECRRGTLLLTENVIELLGGEVQDIIVSNSLPGLLSSKLGLVIQAPTSIEQNPLVSQSHASNAITPRTHTHAPPDMPAPTFEPTLANDQPIFQDNDDDIDIDQLADIEAQITENPTKRSLENGSTNAEKRLKLDHRSITNLHCKIPKVSNLEPLSANNIEDYPDDNDFFNEDEDYLRELEAKIDASENIPSASANKTANVSPEPFVYIKQINEMNDSEKVGRVFKVKAMIVKLLSKLTVDKVGWSLKCSIIDGTGSIDVEFTSDVLSDLVGITPQEMYQLKKHIATSQDVKDRVANALKKAKEALQVLYCIIELTILEVPKITSLTPFEASHVELLKKRTGHIL